jgi:hypothetical protein
MPGITWTSGSWYPTTEKMKMIIRVPDVFLFFDKFFDENHTKLDKFDVFR